MDNQILDGSLNEQHGGEPQPLLENVELMRLARESLEGKWGLAIGTTVVYMLMLIGIQIVPCIGPIAGLIISGPMAVGFMTFILAISRNQNAELSQIFDGFNKFGNAVGTYLLSAIFIFLWMLLLIVPGIIAAISYSQAFFILAEDGTVGPMEAIDRSKKMMEGYKWKLFCLWLRFFGWALLCILTLGIGFLWLMPYMYVSMAKFYENIKFGNN